MRGQIFNQPGNDRFSLTTDERIFFYTLEKDSLEVKLNNVMNNFMQCSIMMFESKDRFGISFKLNAPDFVIYARRFFHNFTIHISRADNEGAVGANLSKRGEYVMADKTQV